MDLLDKLDLPAVRSFNSRTEVIELRERKRTKGSRGVLLDYVDNPETVSMRQKLHRINDWNGRHWIDLRVTDDEMAQIAEKLRRDKDRQPFDSTRTAMRRVFNNGSFDEGGRLYGGWWMEIPNREVKWRRAITINGDTTVEIDYSGLHKIEGIFEKKVHGAYLLRKQEWEIWELERHRQTVKSTLPDVDVDEALTNLKRHARKRRAALQT